MTEEQGTGPHLSSPADLARARPVPTPRPPATAPAPPTPPAPAAPPVVEVDHADHATPDDAAGAVAVDETRVDEVGVVEVGGDEVGGDEEGSPAVTTEFPAVPAAGSDPHRWGRVDTDGTVWLTAVTPERSVGSWQAGDAEEGLAHFARRFDDLRTEIDLLVRRLREGRGDARAALRSATAVRERLVDAAVVGDLPALSSRVDAVVAAAEQLGAAERAARAGARDEAVGRKEALIAEAEALAEETTRWKHAGDRFAAMLDEWKAVRGVDRKTDDALWKRFGKAREGFARRRGAHFAELDRARTVARTRKEELVAEAEALADSSEWGSTAGRYKELMTEWKAAGRTSKDADDALWARFRGAQDTFFARRSAEYGARDAELVANAGAKEALLAEAARIDLSDVEGARAALRGVQERWDEIGKVPRERVREFSVRLQEVEDRVRTAVDRRWAATGGEAEARLGQFRERVAAFEAQAGKARAAGDRRRAEEAESQAAQWREWLATAERAQH